MSERERWVVYPLLFLALGVSLRDKLGGRLTSKVIACQELVIEDEPIGSQEPRRLAVLGRVQPAPNRPSVAALQIKGEINVEGGVNANFYAQQGVLIVPLYQPMPAPSSSPRVPPGNKSAATKSDDANALPSRGNDQNAGSKQSEK